MSYFLEGLKQSIKFTIGNKTNQIETPASLSLLTVAEIKGINIRILINALSFLNINPLGFKLLTFKYQDS